MRRASSTGRRLRRRSPRPRRGGRSARAGGGQRLGAAHVAGELGGLVEKATGFHPQLRLGRTRTNGVHEDTMLCVRVGEHPRQRQLRRLGDRVFRGHPRWPLGGRRADVDDPSPSALGHAWSRRAHRPHRCHHVQLPGGLPVLVGDLVEGAPLRGAGAPPGTSKALQLDVLVNNAGTAKRRSLDEVPDEDWQAAWELNVMAPLRAMRRGGPGMAERGWGRIVNVCSSAAKRPSGMTPEYSVTKAAELSLSRRVRRRVRPARRPRQRRLPRPDEVRAVDGARRPAGPVRRARGHAAARRRSVASAPAARSAASPRSTRSPTRSSSCARSARPTSPARRGASTAAPSR